MEELNTVGIPKYLGFLENLVEETGQNGFAIGDAVSNKIQSFYFMLHCY